MHCCNEREGVEREGVLSGLLICTCALQCTEEAPPPPPRKCSRGACSMQSSPTSRDCSGNHAHFVASAEFLMLTLLVLFEAFETDMSTFV
jgi:hypothetical protein